MIPRFSIVLIAIVFSDHDPVAVPGGRIGVTSRPAAAAVDLGALFAAARNASPVLCGLAADALGGWSGGWGDAPTTPIGPEARARVRELQRAKLSATDVETLTDSLGSEDACVRELSVRLIGRSSAESVVAGLIQRLDSRSPREREVAALGLGLVHVRETGPESGRGAVEPLMRALRDETVGVRADAAWALGRLGDARALGPLTALVRDREAMVRAAVVIALGQLDRRSRADSGSVVPVLLRVLREDDASQVRRAAAWALGQVGSREAVNGLIAALQQERNDEAREMIAWALGTLHSAQATAALVAALRRDASDDVRETAAWALGELHDRSAADALGDAVASDRSTDVRGTAAWALGQIRPQPAPPAVVRAMSELLSSPDEGVRTKAAWALSEIGDPAAVPALRTALRQEKDALVRRAEVRALLHSGEHSEESLGDLLHSSDPAVREAAVRGLVGGSMGPWPWPWPRPRPFP